MRGDETLHISFGGGTLRRILFTSRKRRIYVTYTSRIHRAYVMHTAYTSNARHVTDLCRTSQVFIANVTLASHQRHHADARHVSSVSPVLLSRVISDVAAVHVHQPERLQELIEVDEAVLVDVHAASHVDHLVVRDRLAQVVSEQRTGVGELIQRQET